MPQRSSTEIAADLIDYRAARSALIKGERVEDVWRDGRRMSLATVTLKDINTAIEGLEREYDQAVAVEGGGQRRRPVGLAWRN